MLPPGRRRARPVRLPTQGSAKPAAPYQVPEGAEVLLETRQPYLTAQQRRDVLASTAIEARNVMLDGFEQWGRINLFAAADGYGSFAQDVTVTLDASRPGFAAADATAPPAGQSVQTRAAEPSSRSATLARTGSSARCRDAATASAALAYGSSWRRVVRVGGSISALPRS